MIMAAERDCLIHRLQKHKEACLHGKPLLLNHANEPEKTTLKDIYRQ